MSDYINYIDSRAIKLADLAIDIGDYNCASENYSKALKRLRYYQGDRMQPAFMASDLEQKVNYANNNIPFGQSILKPEGWRLTKTSFVKGSQCLKYLYLDKHKKHEKTPFSKEKLKLFKKGHNFEDTVRLHEFPGGINVKEKVGDFRYFNSYTNHLINTKEHIIYEATIIEKGVLVMCDILVQHKNGLIDIYEIKLSSKLNKAILNDLAVQFFVCKKRFGDKLNSFNAITRSDKIGENWTISDFKDDLDKRHQETSDKIRLFFSALNNFEPTISMGEHCNKPYDCEFIDYCKKKSEK